MQTVACSVVVELRDAGGNWSRRCKALEHAERDVDIHAPWPRNQCDPQHGQQVRSLFTSFIQAYLLLWWRAKCCMHDCAPRLYLHCGRVFFGTRQICPTDTNLIMKLTSSIVVARSRASQTAGHPTRTVKEAGRPPMYLYRQRITSCLVSYCYIHIYQSCNEVVLSNILCFNGTESMLGIAAVPDLLWRSSCLSPGASCNA